MPVVSNAGPLIALARIGRLDLIERLFGQVIIPPAVHAGYVVKLRFRQASDDNTAEIGWWVDDVKVGPLTQ